MLPTLSPPPAPFSARTDIFRAGAGRGLGRPGTALSRPGTALSLGAPSPGQDGDRASLPRTPLAHFSGETATGPRTKGGREDLSPPPEHPAPAFLVGYPFSLLCVCLGRGLLTFHSRSSGEMEAGFE
ncbi:unnamed protein product [Rangifer tarandus platyrhynchus]|uniref:Uncharacterized protein n=1 Tax=Rangifer tarandus platyrhynchus TaxID=3082113 RepID=A0AC59Z6T1_RANTA